MSIKDALNDDLEQCEKVAKGKGETLKPGTYIVNLCSIDYGNGVKHELTAYLQEIHIFEDMEKFGITGWIELLDTDNLISGYADEHQIVGQEVIILKFRNLYSQYPVDCSRHPLQVTKIENLAEQMQGEVKSQLTYVYRIHFCSPEMLLNDRIRVSKTYTDTWSAIVEDILVNQLKTQKRIVIQPTMDQCRIVVPYMHPYDAINSILKKALAGNQTMPNYHFYETTKGFKFRTMQGFLGGNDDHQITYTFSPTLMEGSYVFRMHQAINYSVMRLGDSFSSINNGMWAGKSIEHDSYHKVYNTATVGYHYDLPIKQTSNAAKYKEFATESDVYGATRTFKQWRSPESGSLKADAEVFELESKSVSDFPNSRFSVTSTGTPNTYNTLSGTRITDNSIVFPVQTQSLLRAMQLEHDNYHLLGLTVHGQSGLQVGDKIGIETLTLGQPSAAKELTDRVLSDYYYIIKLSHNINLVAQTYSCNLVCAKEGQLTYPLPANGNLSKIAEAEAKDEVLWVASGIQEKDFEG